VTASLDIRADDGMINVQIYIKNIAVLPFVVLRVSCSVLQKFKIPCHPELIEGFEESVFLCKSSFEFQ
jgi:hypothetical protein